MLAPNPRFVDGDSTQGETAGTGTGSEDKGETGSAGAEAGDGSGESETSGTETGNDPSQSETSSTETGTEDSEGGDDDCEPGMLDCDDEPGCESSAQSPLTCGSCDHSCEFAGAVYDCESDQCVGSPVLSGFADAYIDAEDPMLNRGMDNDFHIRGGDKAEESYIAIPPLPPGALVLDAQLVLDCSGPDLPVNYDVFRVESGWDEHSVVWQGGPQISNAPVTEFHAESGESSIDFGVFADDWPSPHGITLRKANGDTAHTTCSSKEGDNPPRLELELVW